jgi:dipeptidyl aminopeptidase/acylaminoacyl peptidase
MEISQPDRIMIMNPSHRLLAGALAIAAGAALTPFTQTALAQTGAATESRTSTDATGTATTWTPELSMQFRQVQGTAISPDGRLVAYVVRDPVMDGEKSEYRSHIWLAAADGSRNAQFTRGEHSATNPAFSPDGRRLAFTTSRSGRSEIWVMPVDGGEAERVTDAASGVGSYAWSPDGASIAYLMTDPQTDEEKQRERERRDVIVVDTDFKNAHVYIIGVADGLAGRREARQTTRGDFHISSFDWSPDGRSIVYAHNPDPRINTNRVFGDISVVDVASGTIRPLVQDAGVHSSPLVSPDGRSVAYVSTGDQPQGVGLGDVFVVPLAGGTPGKLADTPDRSANLVAWSRDGRALYVNEAVGVDRHLIELPADGRAARILTQGDGVFAGFSLSADGSRLAFTYQNADTPVEVHTSPVQRFAARRLSAVNEGVARPPLARTELLRWTSPDGLEIEGLLTYPADYQPGRRYPLVLEVHGGPAGVFSRTFTGGPGIYKTQVFAQHGYAVLRPNPRGSTGYGRDFRFANVRDWGFGDYEDLMSGVDHAIALGVAHADSLLLMGWSYGGYMTSFAVTRTDRFKAASMGAGLPNLISMTTTTDIGDYLVAHMGAEFWDDIETYQRHSAMYRIANVTTPTQVIHGDRDLRVPFTQGQEFYTALVRRGVPTEMIVLPRTPHSPTEPKLLMEVTPRIISWFERHLRGGARPAT